MTESHFLDPALVGRIGIVDPIIVSAIDAEVREVVADVVGRYIPEIETRYELLALLAPWAWDLGRGLHWHAVRGKRDLRAEEMLEALSDRHIHEDRLEKLARTLDTAWALTYHRLIQQLHGAAATAEGDPDDVRRLTPWLDAAILGIRIHIALELLRLTGTSES